MLLLRSSKIRGEGRIDRLAAVAVYARELLVIET